MSGVTSIFDTPRPQPTAKQLAPEGSAGGKQHKRKSPSASKQKMIDQLLQEHLRELESGSGEPTAKKSKKKNTSDPTSKKPSKKNTTSEDNLMVGKTSAKMNASSGDVSAAPTKGKKKPQIGLKIKLQDVKKHKQKLRKSIDALNRSKRDHGDMLEDELHEASFDGEVLKNGSNHSTPVAKKDKTVSKKGKNKSHIMPLPIHFTPSKVVIKQEPKTPKVNGTPAGQSVKDDSEVVGREKFAWVIHPTPVDTFLDEYWEKKPFLIQRKNVSYYSNLLSRDKIDEMLRNHNIEYTKNIDITSYKEGKRETHNPDGRVLPPDMWGFYEEGCSIRMLNPQTYLNGVYEMNVKLQEFFHCMTGANFYLTPPNSQGFAPHYDDIEAFVVQVEGRKHWKLYSPRDASEVLARVSSPNFRQEEIGLPILEVTLEPGDMLYFPRGIIHQACTVPGHHSLHVTMSVYQKNSWADLLEMFLPHALAQAAENHLDLRRGVPMDLHQYFGIVNSDNESATRKQLVKQVKGMLDKIFSEEALDVAVDQLAKRFQHDALPPLVEENELQNSVYANNYNHNADGTVTLRTPFTEQTTVRLLRRNVLRLVNEEDKLRIYYHTDNSREYHEYEPNFLEVDRDAALGVELLVKMYPQAVTIANLPVDDKVEFAKSLWEKGLIVVHGK